MDRKATIVNNVVSGGPALHVPAHLSFGQYIIDMLRTHADFCGDRPALINGETGHRITYKDLLQSAVNAAAGIKKLGVKRGDIVAFCSENRDEYIPAAIGTICCGATITTANLYYTKDEMTHVLNISRPNIIFASETALEQNIKVFKSASYIKKIIQFDGKPVEKGVIPYSSVASYANVDEYEPEEVKGWTDVVFILYSSGTTGLPKGVMLTHLNLLYGAVNFNAGDSNEYEQYLRFLTLVPWYHAYGLLSTLNFITVRRTLIYFASFNPLDYLNAIQEHKCQVLLTVPPLVVFLAKSPLVEEYDMSSVNAIWCGAAPLSAETIEEAMKRFPNCRGIMQAYGMTETSLAATSDVDKEDATELPKQSKPGSGGIPLRGVKAKVIDVETGRKLGPNQKGEVCLKGPVVMKGYTGDRSATRNMLDAEGYLKTGDIGFYDEDGYFFIVDRLKELIKYKGSQVPPAEVENVLLQHEAVAECGVVGAPDERVGELPTAFVVLKPGVTVTEKELLDFTASRLSPEKRLRGGIIFTDEVPKNQSGKILRRVLKEQLRKKKKSKL